MIRLCKYLLLSVSCLVISPRLLSQTDVQKQRGRAYSILYQRIQLDSKQSTPRVDTMELLLSQGFSRYAVWRRDALLQDLKAEKAGVVASKPRSIVTAMGIAGLRASLEQAGLNTQMKQLRPWFVPKDMEVLYQEVGVDSLSFCDELPKKGLISYRKAKPVLSWSNHHETRTILGHTCHKATVMLDGRCWVAWYAQELPLDGGPAGFGGLSGLILALEEAGEQIKYQAIGLKQSSVEIEEVALDPKAKRLREQDYKDLRASERMEHRYYLLGADGNLYFVYMDTDEYETLREQDK